MKKESSSPYGEKSNKLISLPLSWESFLPNTHLLHGHTNTTQVNTMITRPKKADINEIDIKGIGIASDWRIKGGQHYRVNGDRMCGSTSNGLWRTPFPVIRALTGSFDMSPIFTSFSTNSKQDKKEEDDQQKNESIRVDRVNGMVPLPVHACWCEDEIELSDEVANGLRAILSAFIHRLMKRAYSLLNCTYLSTGVRCQKPCFFFFFFFFFFFSLSLSLSLSLSVMNVLGLLNRTISSRTIQTCVRQELRGELAKHAVSGAVKLVTKHQYVHQYVYDSQFRFLLSLFHL
jgi:hypothetical protein